MRVPRSFCIVLDYNEGMLLHEGAWPRLRVGLSAEPPLPWDLLQGLALVDAAAGEGSRFWQRYATALLPAPQLLSLPMCLPDELLGELRHQDIVTAALAQRRRLKELFGGAAGEALTATIAPGLPSALQWGFGCVRSRAFRLGQDAFGFVPFMDVANHADRSPAADFQVAPDGAVEMFALRPIAAGEEVTISYTGEAGFTNQRLMAQYGFVSAGGNLADRLQLELPGSTGLSVAEMRSGGALCLARIQRVLGDTLFTDMVTGKHPHLYAALKSLPTHDQEEGEWPLTAREVDLASALLSQVTAAQEAMGEESVEADEQAVATMQALVEEAPEGGVEYDTRLLAVIRYRLQRKKLLAAASSLLGQFVGACSTELGA